LEEFRGYSKRENGQEGTSLEETFSNEKAPRKSYVINATNLATTKLGILFLRKTPRQEIQKKVIMATWDDTNSSSSEKNEEHAANLCLMVDFNKEEVFAP